jgi:hypothetical protein
VYILTTVNVRLLVASALIVQSGVLFVSYQPKSAVQKVNRHWRHLKGNYELNSAFEKADRLLEPRAYWHAVSMTKCAADTIKPMQTRTYRKKWLCEFSWMSKKI